MAVARLAAQRSKEHYEGKINEENTKLQNLKAAAETISQEFKVSSQSARNRHITLINGIVKDLRNKASSIGEEEEGSTRSLRQIEADLSSLNNTLSRYESR